MTPRRRFILPAALALLVCALAALAGQRAGLAQDPTTVQPGTAAIWTDQHDYTIGDSVNVCYRIPIAGQITIINIPPGNTPTFYSGESSGTSGCLPGIITPPAGTQCLRLSFPLFGGQGQTQTCFNVEGNTPPITPLAIYINPSQGVYNVGQGIDVCYRVPAPGPIRIIDQIEEDTPTTFFSGYDDGTGGCIPGTITPPTGRECMTIVFTYQADGREINAQTCFQTQ